MDGRVNKKIGKQKQADRVRSRSFNDADADPLGGKANKLGNEPNMTRTQCSGMEYLGIDTRAGKRAVGGACQACRQPVLACTGHV